MSSYHRYLHVFEPDADYIVFASFDWRVRDWVEHTRWLIPGSQIEEDE